MKFNDILKQKLTIHERNAIRYRFVSCMAAILVVVFGGISLIEILGSLFYDQQPEPSFSWLMTVVCVTLMFLWGWREKKEEKTAIQEYKSAQIGEEDH